MSYRRRRRYNDSRSSSSLWIVILVALVALGAYIYTAKSFERNAPSVDVPNFIYWNRKDPLKITLTQRPVV